jgi:hypothetical protein
MMNFKSVIITAVSLVIATVFVILTVRDASNEAILLMILTMTIANQLYNVLNNVEN